MSDGPDSLAMLPASRGGQQLLGALRGIGRQRPPIDPSLAERLRRDLEEAARGVWALDEGITVTVTKRTLQRVLACERHLVASLREVRRATVEMVAGQLLDHLFGLVTVGARPGEDPVADALVVAEIADDQGLLDEWRTLTPDEQAELHYSVPLWAEHLAESWPALPANALARLQEPIRVPLAGGRAILSGRVDLALGAPGAQIAGTTLVDLKSGRRRREDQQEAAWYALLETLRHRALPFQSGNYYLRDGGLELLEVTPEMLDDVAARVAEALRRLIGLAGGRVAGASPSDLCPWCPALGTCDPGRRHVAERGLEVRNGGASAFTEAGDDDDQLT